MDLFGYEITKKVAAGAAKQEKSIISPIPKPSKDGEITSAAVGGGYYGQYIDLAGTDLISDHELIKKYRDAALHPECDAAISDIVNEAIASSDSSAPVTLNLKNLEQPDNVKKQILEQFEKVISLYNFNQDASEIFRQWYVDGRSYYHVMIDQKNPQRGILELRKVDPTQINKIKEVKKIVDKEKNVEYEKVVDEYYVFSEYFGGSAHDKVGGVKIAKDAIIQCNSGLNDPNKRRVISYLHKALKLVNQLRYMEDSLVVYRVSRAPERRIFYIDVGNLPKGKAEEYVQQVVSRYRNKLVYDASTGDISDDRRHMSMLEDFYLPRREGGRGTEIDTLGGGDNLGQIDDVLFFQKKLYKALNVPSNRLEEDSPTFNIGKSGDITREEVKFQKFVNRIRKNFAFMFMDALRIQLILKGIITESDWDSIKESINVNFLEDNYFAELKEFEILRERLEMAQQMEDLVEKKYLSAKYVRQVILKQSEEDMERIAKEVEEEGGSEEEDDFDI